MSFYPQGLDRFAQFFVKPLMRVESMEREREAVDSEFEGALPSDSNRREQLFGTLAKDGHPMSKFMWGNLKSLKPDKVQEYRKTAMRNLFLTSFSSR